MVNAINIKTIDKPGVLRKVTDFLAKKNINIVYTHMFQDSTGYAHMYIELEDVIDIENLLNLGVERVVVGSVAVKNPELVRGWLNMYGPEHFTLALDVRLVDGVPYVATHGWLKTSNTTLDQVLRHYLPYHIEHVLVTDISKDGMMSGANNSLYAQLYAKYPDLDIIASGGISSLDDVKAVARAGAHSVVLGRSLLEGKFTVEEAVKCWQNA